MQTIQIRKNLNNYYELYEVTTGNMFVLFNEDELDDAVYIRDFLNRKNAENSCKMYSMPFKETEHDRGRVEEGSEITRD